MKRSLKIWFFLAQVGIMALAFASQSFLASMATSVIAGVGIVVVSVAIIFKNFNFLQTKALVMTKTAYFGTMVQLFFSTTFTIITLAPGTQDLEIPRVQATLVALWILSSVIVWFAAKRAIRNDSDLPQLI